MNDQGAHDVKVYISTFSEAFQNRMIKVRDLILQHAPEAEESISYGIPSYKTFGKPLIYFAGFKNHIGLYATPSGHEKFKKELSTYKQGRGSVQFLMKEEMPYDLIEQIIKFRVDENASKFGK
ncbi:MAG: DUF1801 domain-containing protein [Saprospiraceae bacterium]|mgnify:FL=1|nr:DUF1801 domain-containing protein [Saprospiraceae bacterium]MBP7642677.1 DUF1801 domain-containing protein [Saprospiraceae bacterium]